MDITIIHQTNEGFHESVQVYAGRLNKEQLATIMVGPNVGQDGGYARFAILEFYTQDGAFEGLDVTFSNDSDDGSDKCEAAGPEFTNEHWPNGNVRITGHQFTDDMRGYGRLGLHSSYDQLQEAPVAVA